MKDSEVPLCIGCGKIITSDETQYVSRRSDGRTCDTFHETCADALGIQDRDAHIGKLKRKINLLELDAQYPLDLLASLAELNRKVDQLVTRAECDIRYHAGGPGGGSYAMCRTHPSGGPGCKLETVR